MNNMLNEVDAEHELLKAYNHSSKVSESHEIVKVHQLPRSARQTVISLATPSFTSLLHQLIVVFFILRL